MMQNVKPIPTYQALWLITFAWVTLFFIPRISEKGMFIDGLVYTTLAHNLSEDIGTFWKPVMYNSGFLFQQNKVFYDHPPLMFGIESVFYSLFGLQTEWIYNTLILLLLLISMLQIFRLFEPEKHAGWYLGFLPVFFLFMIPELIQKITYNLLDTTLALFTAVAVYCLLRAIHRTGNILLWSTAGGVFTVLAFLTKGPVGLFPLATPFLYFIFYDQEKSWKKPLIATMMVTVILLLAGAALYAYLPSHQFFDHYLNQQVIASMKGEREKANTIYNHLSIFKKVFVQISPMLILSVILWWIRRKAKSTSYGTANKTAWLFLMIAFSASAPIAISAKHHSFYLFPSFIFFALAFSFFLSAYFPLSWLIAVKKINFIPALLAMIAIVTISIYSFSRKERYYHSHREVLQEIESFAPKIPVGSLIGAESDILNRRGDVCCYLERYYQIRMDPLANCCSYFLARTSMLPDSNMHSVITTKNFVLYKNDHLGQ